MIRAIIIEDEFHSSELLKEMIQVHCKMLEVVGVATSVSTGIHLIQTQQPDLVFLDIYISEGIGFDILDVVQPANFKVIFVTGYEAYALKAIKYSALDYLLKPVILEELVQAVDKAKKIMPPPNDAVEFLKEKLVRPVNSFERIVLSDYKTHCIINVKDIVFIEAKRGYTIFHLQDKQTRLTSNSLNHYEDLLPDTKFYRIHKSYLVNCDEVIGLETGRGGQIKLIGGQLLPIAVRRKAAFLRFFNKTTA